MLLDLSAQNATGLISLLIWGVLWALGGVWVVQAAFHLRRNEQVITGLAAGLILQTWLANLLGHILPAPWAFWLPALLVLLSGLLLRIKDGWRALLGIPFNPIQILLFLAVAYVFTAIGRGLALFDDYAHLPAVSILATGALPLRFPLDPALPYGYHYFLLLTAAQMMRIGWLHVWTALDLARGIAFALGILLVGLWAQRLTRSALAGFLAGVLTTFSMGTRWLLLLLPQVLVQPISQSVHLLGSAVESAPNLTSALTAPWGIEGGGPFSFPFAFVNSLSNQVLLVNSSTSLIGLALMVIMLLTFNRWRGRLGGLVCAILLSSISLIDETWLVLGLAGWVLVTLTVVLRRRSLRLPPDLAKWWAVLAVVVTLSLVQGGAISEMLHGWLAQSGSATAASSYRTFGLRLVFPPVLVSAHLGVLSLVQPRQALAALIEIGPILLGLPLVLVYGVKAFRIGRYYEAAAILGGFLAFSMLFVQFGGSAGEFETSKLYSFIGMAELWSLPLLWIWVVHRSDRLRTLAAAWGTVLVFGGIVLFGIELIAAQKPVSSTFISQLDRAMHQEYWDKLEPGALIFDSIPSRAPTVFGRHTDSCVSWQVKKPEYLELYDKPDPYALQAAGFGYLYVDYVYDYEVYVRYPGIWQQDCMVLLREMHAKHTEDFRRLYDIRACMK